MALPFCYSSYSKLLAETVISIKYSDSRKFFPMVQNGHGTPCLYEKKLLLRTGIVYMLMFV